MPEKESMYNKFLELYREGTKHRRIPSVQRVDKNFTSFNLLPLRLMTNALFDLSAKGHDVSKLINSNEDTILRQAWKDLETFFKPAGSMNNKSERDNMRHIWDTYHQKPRVMQKLLEMTDPNFVPPPEYRPGDEHLIDKRIEEMFQE